MKQPARRREAVGILAVSSLVSALSVAVVVFLAPVASASGDPADKYAVINGTANAATQHEVAGSSAFPNFVTGAVDNYYSLAHAYVDNSPFAEGTASPADTGPIGQTAAAGNFSQPQYADARWSGQQPDKETFGNQGGPYAVATADTYNATANAQEASSPSSNSGGSGGMTLAAPKGFSGRLRTVLAAWKAKWLPRLDLRKPPLPVGGGSTPPPPVTVPTVTVPTVTLPVVGAISAASTTTTPTLTSPTSTSTTPTSTTPTSTTSTTTTSTTSTTSSSPPPDNAALDSATQVMIDPDSGALVTSGESSLGRVSIGSGQIVIKGIDVTASITNDGTPTDKIAVDIGAATIGGVPVTIDQNGVTVNGQTQDLSQVYGQADSALNTALKQAGIQLFTVQPEVTKASNQETITAAGLDVQFTQPVHQGGVPDQYVQHLLGEVYVDSLAVPGTPFSFNIGGSGGGSSAGGGKTGAGAAGSGSSSTGVGGSIAGGSTGGASTGFPTSSSGSSSQPTSGPGGTASQAGPMVLVSALGKPVWLLLSYFVWQVLVIGTGAALWRWRIGGAL